MANSDGFSTFNSTNNYLSVLKTVLVFRYQFRGDGFF